MVSIKSANKVIQIIDDNLYFKKIANLYNCNIINHCIHASIMDVHIL